MGVSVPSVKRAKKMLEVATPSEVKEVKAGKKTVSEVLTAHEEKPAEQSEVSLADCNGRKVPSDIVPLWNEALEISERLLQQLRKVKQEMSHGIEARETSLVWRDCTNGDTSGLEATINTLNLTVKPHAVCYVCNGVRPQKCKLCRGRGFIGKHLWTTCPEETKKMLAKGK